MSMMVSISAMSSPVLQFCGSESPGNRGDDDDDETEVFFGAVSNRERRKASKFDNRRTVVFHPDFRKDRKLMRYTMDHLQLLALAAANHGKTGAGSEGSDSCGSLEGSSTGSSPVTDSDDVVLPLEQWMAALSFSPEGGASGSGGLSCRYLDSPLSGAADILDQVCQSDGMNRQESTENSCVLGAEAQAVECENKNSQVLVVNDKPDAAMSSPHSSPCTSNQGAGQNHRINAQNSTNAPDTPKMCISSHITNMADSSPLVNTASSSNTVVASPQTIFGDLASLCDGEVTYSDIFSQNPNSPMCRSEQTYVASEPQEVPNVLPPVGQQEELNDSNCDLWYNTDSGSHDDGDVSIVTLGSVVDESLLDSSRRTYQYDTETDSDTSLCHQVPDVPVDSPVFLRKERNGVLFTEKQFSPTLTVRVSPPVETPPTSPRRKNKLVLDLSKTHAYFSSLESLPPESPECLSEVKFSLSCEPPMSPSPKKTRVKRLSPSRSPRAEARKKTGSVFDRLYGLRKTPQSEKTTAKIPAARKLDVGKPRSQSVGKFHGRVESKVGKSPRAMSTPPAGTGNVKRGLKFSGSKTSADAKSHSPGVSIKTTGTVNRTAICQATKTTPTKHRRPGGINLSGMKSPSVPPTFRKGTPRHLPGAEPKGGNVKNKQQNEPPPKLNLDDSLSDVGDDADSLDASILLQEKKVELERLHLAKIKLQKRVTAAKKKSSDNLSPTTTPSRSPLVPTTSHNLPKVRYNDRQSLSLSEPELDAITLVHTLCNSQQVAKLVSKQRAANVARNTMHNPKPASRIQWRENLVSEDPIETDIKSEQETGKRRSILTIRQPGHFFPYSDQPPSPIVVTKGTRKFTGFVKDPGNVQIV